jgi:predicted unusual protein kinase regulating ubiquinone biosynthesis (AarF/ABC1/UbiB family)
VGRISEKTKNGVMALIQGMIVKDYRTIAESMLAIGMTRKKVDTAMLAKDLEDFYNASESYAVEGLQVYPPALEEPEQILLDMVRIAEAHGIRFPGSSPCF